MTRSLSSHAYEHGGEFLQADIDVGSRKGFVRAEGVVQSEPKAVVERLADFEQLASFLPGLRESSVLSRGASWKTVRFEMKLPFPVGRLVWTNRIVERVVDDGFCFEWQLISGDLAENDGRLEILSMPGNPAASLLRYAVNAKTKRAFPLAAQRLATRWLLPRVMLSVRAALENAQR